MSALSKVCAVRDHHDDALGRFWLTIHKDEIDRYTADVRDLEPKPKALRRTE